MMDTIEIVGIALLVVFFIAMLLYFAQNFLGKSPWKDDVIDKLNVLQKLNSSKEEIKIKSALIDADKLLDHVFKKRGMKGETMGDRLKEAKTLLPFELYNQVWEAHKIRNKLVHEIDFHLETEKLSKEFWTLRTAIVRLVK